jgi:hypothetical protein
LLYHLLQVLPLLVAGLVFEYRLVLGHEGDPATAESGDPQARPTPPPAPPPSATSVASTTPQPSTTRP